MQDQHSSMAALIGILPEDLQAYILTEYRNGLRRRTADYHHHMRSVKVFEGVKLIFVEEPTVEEVATVQCPIQLSGGVWWCHVSGGGRRRGGIRAGHGRSEVVGFYG